eukprot:CAMPEP_0172692004 /NCGR_PEP_ID=MMETSP1074-20121228/24933_1 /TAXON_ID=2916 /ORGANISM="Ceratium fusus, Strain PA161109" /LENGTH=55 /DNA_ID=CAMNT_0013512125 /DNA_START=490 /DNA_END=653 /DNA_ORIENTATION=-
MQTRFGEARAVDELHWCTWFRSLCQASRTAFGSQVRLDMYGMEVLDAAQVKAPQV